MRLSKRLSPLGRAESSTGVLLRNYSGEPDDAGWLALRKRCFPPPAGARSWGEREFEREFLSQPWWHPQRMWLALDNELLPPIGAVVLAGDPEVNNAIATVHWLMVDPDHRRSGIGGMLLEQAESLAWEDGFQMIGCETLAKWRGSVAFYRKHGYQ